MKAAWTTPQATGATPRNVSVKTMTEENRRKLLEIADAWLTLAEEAGRASVGVCGDVWLCVAGQETRPPP
jgi:hypothetical protein